jgi:hypothetical protein
MIDTTTWRTPPKRMRAMLLALLALPALAHAAPPKGPVGTQIGVIVPQSWPDKQQGEDIVHGMMLALKTWPHQPAPTLVVRDSACDSRKAAAAAQELIAAKVDVLVSGFCVLGAVPALARDAGLPYVSANAERLASVPDTMLQFGLVPVNMASGIAARLRSETGLRVTADSACWIDFGGKLPERVDAALCPTLRLEAGRFDEIAPTFSAAYRQPFSASAVRGYAAMEAALAAIKQLRAGSKPAQVFKDAKEVRTLLGTLRAHDDAPPPPDAMQLVLAPKLPKLSAREAAAFDELMKAKACGCVKTGQCPASSPWHSTPFVLACCAKGTCAMGAVASAR